MPAGSSSTPKYGKSKTVIKTGSTINSINITVTFTGSIKFHVTADGGSNWEEVSNLTSASRIIHSFTTTGTDVRWYAILAKGSRITQIKMSEAS